MKSLWHPRWPNVQARNKTRLSWVILKPRPNDRNMPTQHIATLLGATCCVRLATLLWCVVGSSLKMVKFEPTAPNMSQHWCRIRVIAICCVGMLRSFRRGFKRILMAFWRVQVFANGESTDLVARVLIATLHWSRCSPKRSESLRSVSPTYNLWQRWLAKTCLTWATQKERMICLSQTKPFRKSVHFV